MNLLYIEKLEAAIKEIANSALRISSVLVDSELIKLIKDDKLCSRLMAAMDQLHKSCTQKIVAELFEKDE